MVGEACGDFKSLAQGNYNATCPGIEPTTLGLENHEPSARTTRHGLKSEEECTKTRQGGINIMQSEES